jgi:hypothetical protein
MKFLSIGRIGLLRRGLPERGLNMKRTFMG